MKKIIIGFLILCSSVLNATTYYVSNTGSDAADGTSASTPWQTVDYVSTKTFLPGDNILLKAGDVFRGELFIHHGGSAGNYITYSRYGTGSNPKILGSLQASNWVPSGTANVWQCTTTFDNVSTEYYAARIFFEANDSVSWGQYKGTSAASCSQEYDYAVNGSTYYVYATSDPDTRYNAIEVTQVRRGIAIPDGEAYSYIKIDGIDVHYQRLVGIDLGCYPEQRGYTNIVVRNCNVGYIGSQPSGFAYGVSSWHSNTLIENCNFSDCGRRAISMNLYISGKTNAEAIHINNVIIRNNTFKRGYHTTGLDLSAQATTTDTIENVYVYNNIFDDSDFGTVCDGCTSNMVFVQTGSGASWFNNIYVVGNLFVESTARSILFEGSDTSYVWNNTIVGHNPNLTINPYNDVVWNSDEAEVYYRNNILYDNIGQNSLQNHGVFIYSTYTGRFVEKDYDLYYSLYPGYGGNRSFSAHRINSTGVMGYWTTDDWQDYITNNTLFEQHSPVPANPLFVDYTNKDYHLTESSTAVGTGLATPWKIITDAFGVVDTINKTDIEGTNYVVGNWDLGAFAYSEPDLTAIDIISFTLPQQTGSANISTSSHTVTIEVAYGTSLTSLTPTINVSQTATINPTSGTTRDFTYPVTYTVTGGDGVTEQVWTVTVIIGEPSTATDINSFVIPNQVGSLVNNTNHTVLVTMPFQSVITDLVPVIGLSTEATINPLSGVAQDFTSPVTYTVTAQDGTTQQEWDVSVKVNRLPIMYKDNNGKILVIDSKKPIFYIGE
jgi:hypothetical protein